MDSEYDLIIIGAGINGAGIARDAAMRGLRVLLLDKRDIGGGTSAWSTRLIHGGLRYLEHAEFGLVRESLREREILMRIAPHLVQPLPLLVPIYDGAGRGRWTIRAGMWAYDLLSFDKTLPRHRFLKRNQTVHAAPSLDPNGLEGAAVYYDAQVEFAERLVLENVLSAIENGATLLTYTRVRSFITQDHTLSAIELVNERTDEVFHASAKLIINAAGPWVDEVLEKIAGSQRLVGGTKGSHIIVSVFRGAPGMAVYVEAERDGRPFFIIPWNNKYLIGTTDIRFEGKPDDVSISDDEIDYLLRETNRILPAAGLNRTDILYAYSGVRPLPYTSEKKEARITRRHFIRQHRVFDNLFSIVGGKLTTYRSLAEETVDLVFRKLNRRSPACRTDRVLLPGAFSVTNDQDPRMQRTYGARSKMVSRLIADDRSLAEVIDEETGATAAEIVHAFRNEMAATLADCLLRRTMVGFNSRCGLNAVEAAAEVGRKHFGWTDEQCAREMNDYRETVRRYLLPPSYPSAAVPHPLR
ncbi:MAG TPA: glycerol-3-phosphate dehydrogenase [Pyrinomonadaceae bacterium]|nr:glycerol-3-phosphate dehydrogenase [Pyrinomonadaceae bacterium]